MNVIYTKKQIAERLTGIVAIKEREIGYWTDLGIIVPAVANPKGRGYVRFYSFRNLIDIAVAKRMADAGLNLKAIKGVMEKLRELGKDYYAATLPGGGAKRLNPLGRIRIVVMNPNSEKMAVGVEVIKYEDSATLTLSMEEAGSYFVLDVTEAILKLSFRSR